MDAVLRIISLNKDAGPRPDVTLSAHQSEQVRTFLRCGGPALLCSYAVTPLGAAERRLAVSSTVPTNAPRVHFFLKLKQDPLTQDNFKGKVCFGSMSSEDFTCVLNFVLQLYRPSVLMPKYPSVPPKSSFTTRPSGLHPEPSSQLLKKRTKAKLIRGIMYDRYTQVSKLPQTLDHFCAHLANLTTKNKHELPLNVTSDVGFDGQKIVVDIAAVEEGVSQWTEQLITATLEVTQAFPPQSEGLLSYIQALRLKGDQLRQLLLQVNCGRVQRALQLLIQQSSPTALSFQAALQLLQACQRCTEHEAEQLQQLQQPLQQLHSAGLEDFIDRLYDLLACLYLSRLASAPDMDSKREGYVVMVSWDVARACLHHLQLSQVFTEVQKAPHTDADQPSEAVSPATIVMICCQEWVAGYTQVYQHFASNGRGDVGPLELPPPAVAVLPVQLLLDRCSDLDYIWTSITQLTRIPSVQAEKRSSEKTKVLAKVKPCSVLERSTAPAARSASMDQRVQEEIEEILELIEDARANIACRQDFAEQPSSRKWIKYFEKFRDDIEESEHRYQCALVSGLQDVRQASEGLSLLRHNRPMVARKSLVPVFFTMINQIMEFLESDMAEAEREYMFRVMHEDEHGFCHSKLAQWCMTTKNILHDKVQMVREVASLPYSPRIDTCYRQWSRTCALLGRGTQLLHGVWCARAAGQPLRRLDQRVLCWALRDHKHFLVENFDRDLSRSLEEAQVWKSLNLKLPASMAAVTDDLTALNAARKQVRDAAQLFNSNIERMSPDEIRLFESAIQNVVASYYPVLTSVSWIQKGAIRGALRASDAAVNNFSLLIKEYVEFNERIYKQVADIKTLLLYKKQDEFLFHEYEFTKGFLKQVSAMITHVRTVFGEIENDLHSLYTKVINEDDSQRCKDTWKSYVEKVDEMFLGAQKEMMTNTMIYLEKMLISSKFMGKSDVPLFYLKIKLIDDKITSCPLIDNLWQTITHLKEIFLEEFQKLPCLLRRFDLAKAKQHQHQSVLNNDAVNCLQAKITEHYSVTIDLLYKDLLKWEQLFDSLDVEHECPSEKLSMSKTNMKKLCEALTNKLTVIADQNSSVVVGTFNADCRDLKKQLKLHCQSKISKRLEAQYSWVEDELSSLERKILALPPSSEPPQTVVGYLAAQKENSEKLEDISNDGETLDAMSENISILQEYGYDIPQKTLELHQKLIVSLDEMKSRFTEEDFELKIKICEYKKQLCVKSEELKFKFVGVDETLRKEFPKIMQRDPGKATTVIKELSNCLQEVETDLSINEVLESLSLPIVKFESASRYAKKLAAAEKISNLATSWRKEWQKWKDFFVNEISLIAFETMLSTFREEFKHVKSRLDQSDSDWRVLLELDAEIASASDLLPVLKILHCAPLLQHHWDQVMALSCRKCGDNFKQVSIGTLYLIECGSFINEIEAIVLDAKQEQSFLNALHELQNEASSIDGIYTDVNSPSLTNLQLISKSRATLSELREKHTILSSAYRQRYFGEIESLAELLTSMLVLLSKLSQLEDLVSIWSPFFQVNDVRLKLINATTHFDDCDGKWKRIIEQFIEEKFLSKMAQQANICDTLSEVTASFSKLAGMTLKYVQNLRVFSPRLNFLDDGEIISLVSQVNSVSSVRPYLHKLFENIVQIKSQRNTATGTLEATGIVSAEGEIVQLLSPVSITGPMFSWLEQVHSELTNTLKESLRQCKAVLKAAGPKIDEPLKCFPQQVCFLALLLNVSGDFAKAKSRPQAGTEILVNQDKFLKEVCARFTRVLSSSTHKILRLNVRRFFSVILSLRDQLNRVREGKIKSGNVEENILEYSMNKESGQLLVHFGPYTLPYCWQYQGIKRMPGLSLTMCQNLVQFARNLSDKQVIGLVGPKNSGKTETYHSMAVLLGHRQFILECNGDFTAEYLSRIIMGSLSVPTFLLFSNALKIKPTVAFLFTEMLQQVSEFQSSNKKQEPQHSDQFQGIPLQVEPSSAVVLECRPSADPEMARSLLEVVPKPIATLPASFSDIVEVELTTRGFQSSKALSKIMEDLVVMTKLSVPARAQYNLGFPFVLSTVLKAVELQKKNPALSEVDVILNSFHAAAKEQLHPTHLTIFQKVLASLHPEFELCELENESLKSKLMSLLEKDELFHSEAYLDNLMTLEKVIRSHTVIGVHGPKRCGKTTALKILKKCFEGSLQQDYRGESAQIELVRIDPYLVGEEKLLGSHNVNSLTNSQIKQHLSDGRQEKWIIFKSHLSMDKFVDAFLGRISSEDPDGDIYCFVPEKLKIPKRIKFFIELSNESPSSRDQDWNKCLWASFSPELNFSTDFISRWLRAHEKVSLQLDGELIKSKVSGSLEAIPHDEKDPLHRMKVFTSLLNAFLDPALQEQNPGKTLEDYCNLALHWAAGRRGQNEDALASEKHELSVPLSFDKDIREVCKKIDVIVTQKFLVLLYVTAILLENSIAIMLTGAPGTGKTTLLDVLKLYFEKKVSCVKIHFNSETSPDQLMKTVTSLADPVSSLRPTYAFIDDVNSAQTQVHMMITLNFFTWYHEHQDVRTCNFNSASDDFQCSSFIVTCLVDDTDKTKGTVHPPLISSAHEINMGLTGLDELTQIALEFFELKFREAGNSVTCLKAPAAHCIVEFIDRLTNDQSSSHDNESRCLHRLANFTRQVTRVFDSISLADVHKLDRDAFLNLFVNEIYSHFSHSVIYRGKSVLQSLEASVRRHFCTEMPTKFGEAGSVYLACDGDYRRVTLSHMNAAISQAFAGEVPFISLSQFYSHVATITSGLASRSVDQLPKTQNSTSGVKLSGKFTLDIEHSSHECVSDSLHLSNLEENTTLKSMLILGGHGVGKRTCALAATRLQNATLVDVLADGKDSDRVDRVLEHIQAPKKIVLYLNIDLANELTYLAEFVEAVLARKWGSCIAGVLIACVDSEQCDVACNLLPALFSRLTVYEICEWSQNDLKTAANYVSGRIQHDIDNSTMESLITSAIQVHLKCQETAADHGLLRHVSSCHFLYFVKRIVERRKSGMEEHLKRINVLKMQIQQFSDATEKVADLNNQLKEQRAQVTHVQQAYSNSTLRLKNTVSEQGRLEEDLSKKKDMIARQKIEYARIKDIIEHDLLEPKTSLKSACNALNRITVEEFEKIRQVLRPDPEVEKVFELVLQLTGMEPSWNEAKKQMLRGIDFVSEVCKLSPISISDSALTYLQKSPLINDTWLSKLKEDHPTVSIFLDWLIKFENFARIYRDCHSLQLQADGIGKDIKETQTYMSRHEYKLTNVKVQQQVLHRQLQEQENQLDKAEVTMKTLESRMQASKRAMSQLDILKEHWDNEIGVSEAKIDAANGDAILKAAQETYFGNFKFEKRRATEKEIQNCLKENGILAVDCRRLDDDDHLISWLNGGLSCDRVTSENASIILASEFFIDVIYDPNNILYESMLALPSARRLEMLDSSSVRKFLSKSHSSSVYFSSQEEICIPVEVHLAYKKRWVAEIHQKKSQKRKEKTVNPKLVIFVKKVPLNVPEFVRAINNGSELESLKHYLCTRITQALTPNTVEDHVKNRAELLKTIRKIKEQNTEIQILMADLESSLLSGSSTLSDLEKVSAASVKQRKKCDDLRKAIKKSQTAMESCEATSLPLCSLFHLLQRLPLWRADLCLPLEKFVEIAVSALPRPTAGQSKWGKLLDQNALFASLSSILGYLQLQVSGPPKVALGLSMALWYHAHLGLISQQHVEAFAADTSACAAATSPFQWLDDWKWAKVLQLQALSEFKDLAKELQANTDAWLQWYTSDYVESRGLPEPFDKNLLTFSKLLLLSKLRPDRLTDAAENFVLKFFKISNEVSNDLIQKSVLKCQANELIHLDTPVSLQLRDYFVKLLAVCYPLTEPTQSIIQFYRLARERLLFIKECLSQAAKKGQWVILLCGTNSDHEISAVMSVLSEDEFNQSHKRFQAWLVSSASSVARGELLSKLERFNTAEPKSIRASVEDYFTSLGDSKLAIYSSEKSKWYLMAQTLSHLSMKARQEVEGESFLQFITDAHWKETEASVRASVASEDSAGPSKFLDELEFAYLPTLATTTAKSVAVSLLGIFFNDVEKMPETIPSFTHYSVPSGSTLDLHKIQLEFIYKARIDILSFCSMKAINRILIREGRVVKRAVRALLRTPDWNLFTRREKQIDIVPVIPSRDAPNISGSEPLMDYAPNISGSEPLVHLINKELDDYKNESQQILPTVKSKFTMTLSHQELSSKWSSCSPYPPSTLAQSSEDEAWVSRQLLLLNERGKYLANFIANLKSETRLDLRQFKHYLPILTSLIRQIYPEWTQNVSSKFFTDLIYMPRQNRQGAETTCIHLDNLHLLNIAWDSENETLSLPLKEEALRDHQVINLCVVPLQSTLGEQIEGSEPNLREIPVYDRDDLSSSPVLKVFLPSLVPNVTVQLLSARLVINFRGE